MKKLVSPLNGDNHLRQAERCLEFRLPNFFLPSSCIWAGTRGCCSGAKAGGPALAHLILSQKALWNGPRAWKMLRRLQSMSIFAL